MPLVYIVHPITTGSNTPMENALILTKIRNHYINNWVFGAKMIPISPLHVFSGMDGFATNSDQEVAYLYSSDLMLGCDTVHIWGNIWPDSEGCRSEVEIARDSSMHHVHMDNITEYRELYDAIRKEVKDATGRINRPIG